MAQAQINKINLTRNSLGVDVEKFRKHVKNYLDKHQYASAEFWADKLVTISSGKPLDIHLLAQCYFLTKQYHRAILLIQNHNLMKNPTCRYLVGKCHYEAGEYQAALDVLDQVVKGFQKPKTTAGDLHIPELDDHLVESAIHLLKGYICEATENRTLAVGSFKEALRLDPLCFEAFHALTRHHMIPLREEKEMLENLDLQSVCNKSEETFVRTVYESKINNYTGSKQRLQCFPSLETNIDHCAAEAETLFYQCDFIQCYKLTQEILSKDPYHPDCLPIHIACLVELKEPNSLFLLGHRLVDLYPGNATSWFAVGCYYYLIGKNDNARRFLSKATTIDRVFGPAWIAYGHSFAAENEHDQARAAYYKAAQLMKGCHLPLLYIGMEYSMINNPAVAERFFKEALAISEDDGFVLHELGIVSYTNHDYTSAEKYFEQAVECIEKNLNSIIPEKWATLLNNLAQTYMKLGKYEESLDMHRNALRVCPGSASTYASIGLVQAYLSDFQEAVISVHKALAIQRDHTVASTLLSNLMHIVVSAFPPVEGDVPVVTFDLANIESTSNKSKMAAKSLQPDDMKESLSSLDDESLQKPEMQETSTNDAKNADTTDMMIEDMVMDDSP